MYHHSSFFIPHGSAYIMMSPLLQPYLQHIFLREESLPSENVNSY